MRVLVIGAKGMLGHAVMDAWFDHDVIGLDLPEFDLTNAIDVRRTMATIQPQLVINCAAYTAVDDCETHEAEADKVNGTGVGYLAKACDGQKATLVQISTDYVFDGQNSDGYAEDAAPNPISAYGRTKLHGEQQLRLQTRRAYLVRTAWLYGLHGKNFVTTMLELGKTKPKLKVVHDQHGQPTYTRDLAAFVKSLVLDRAPRGIYHGVNEGLTTWYDYAKEIFQLAGLTTPVEACKTDEFPRPAQRPAWSIINTKRPKLRNWREALRDYFQEL